MNQLVKEVLKAMVQLALLLYLGNSPVSGGSLRKMMLNLLNREFVQAFNKKY